MLGGSGEEGQSKGRGDSRTEAGGAVGKCLHSHCIDRARHKGRPFRTRATARRAEEARDDHGRAWGGEGRNRCGVGSRSADVSVEEGTGGWMRDTRGWVAPHTIWGVAWRAEALRTGPTSRMHREGRRRVTVGRPWRGSSFARRGGAQRGPRTESRLAEHAFLEERARGGPPGRWRREQSGGVDRRHWPEPSKIQAQTHESSWANFLPAKRTTTASMLLLVRVTFHAPC